MAMPIARPASVSEADRRWVPRVAARVEAEIHLAGVGWLRTCTRDVGTGGVCVETPSPFAPTSVLRLALRLPDAGPLLLPAEGRWQRVAETGVLTGIRFCAPDSGALERLRSFATQRAIEISRFLGEVPELAELPMDEAMDLALSTRIREVPALTWLYGQGTALPDRDSIFVVVSGQVALEAAVPRQPEVLLEKLGSWRLFGGLPLVAGIPHLESAMTETRCELLELDREAFEYLRIAKPVVAHRLVQAVMRRQATQMQALIRQVSGFRTALSAMAA